MTRRLSLNNCDEHNIFYSIKNKYPNVSIAISDLTDATVLHTGILALCQIAKDRPSWHALYGIIYLCN